MLESVEVSPARRRALRRSVHVSCDVISSDWEDPISHTASDLSPYGCWLDTIFPLEPGTVVAVAFTPPRWQSGREIVAFARVSRRVRTGPRRGMALEFLDLCHEDLSDLDETLRGLPPPLALAKPRDKELVWVDALLTWEEDLGDRVNTFAVSEMLGMFDDDDLEVTPLSDPLH